MVRHTFIEQQEESNRAAAQKQMPRIKLEDIIVQGCIRKVKARNMGRLVTQNVEGHDTSQGMCKEVHTAVFLEAGIVLTPKSKDAIGFSHNRPGHFRLVMR
jgi:hypothetical protein